MAACRCGGSGNNPIKKGKPIDAKALKTAASPYPEWISITVFPNPGDFFIYGLDQQPYALALISIGGLPVRVQTITIGGSVYQVPFLPSPLEGFNAGLAPLTGKKVKAPNYWTLLQATSNAGPSDVQDQLIAQMDALQSSGIEILGTMSTPDYDKVSGPGDNFAGQMRVAGKV